MSAQGVTVVVQAVEWPGPVDIDQEVTPLMVRIDNNSDMPVRVRYNEFTLIGPDRASFSALPLVRIEGEVAVRVDAYDAPGFYYRDFAVAPYYSTVYPGIDPYMGIFAVDPYYYETYYDYWTEIELPTPEMRRRVIPEGVVDSGGNLQGWMFFEKVADENLDRVVFRADLVNAHTVKAFAEVRYHLQ